MAKNEIGFFVLKPVEAQNIHGTDVPFAAAYIPIFKTIEDAQRCYGSDVKVHPLRDLAVRV